MKKIFTQPSTSLLFNVFTFLMFLFASIEATAQVQVDIAKNYVNQNFASQKLSATDVSEMKVSSAYLSPTTGWYHVYFNQTYKSVEVYNALMNVTLKDNQGQYLTHSFIPNLDAKVSKESLNANKITPLQAIQNAAASVNLAVSNGIQQVASQSNTVSDDPNKVTFQDSNLSNDKIEVGLYWFAQEVRDGEKITETKMLLVWNVRFTTKDGSKGWNMHVDAFSGQVLKTMDDIIHCNFGTPEHLTTPHECKEHILTTEQAVKNTMVAPNNYNVFDYPLESPNHGSRTVVASPYNRFAPAGTGPGATNGWHDDGTTSYTNTKGNNVDAKDDLANDNEGTVGSSPNSATLDFNYPYTFGTGTAAGNLNAAVTNLFYWNNVIHDILWRYGFDEPSGNFQKNNMGRGGAGNDFIYADAQDGSGTNNANFQTPNDGGNGRMQMYIWSNGGSPAYTPDSDFDNGIIAHEYGHGWSIRLTGGPANSSCLNNVEQGGEGWSDYAALMFTTNWAALTPTVASANIARGIGTYAITQPTTGAGIRPYKYSYDMVNVNAPVTYGKVGDSNFSQPHGIGSIWATMLWDMTWEIILADNQIVSNIYDTPANVADMRGNLAALKLVNEGLRLQPCSPSFVDARDAILQADQMLFGGRYRCAIGRAFARRGLGANASTGTSSNDRIVTEDFTPISGPAITSSLSNTICTNNNFAYTATTASAGISFSWTRASVAGISNPSASGNNASVNETLINTTNAPITVTYMFTLSPDPCGGTTSPQPVRVVVNPRVTPSVGTYSVNQNASVPAGGGLVVSQTSSNTVSGTLTTNSPIYYRSSGGTIYSGSTNTYYQTYTFVAPTNGSMTFEIIAANLASCGTDTHMSLYQGSFNPNSPATNFLQADDDSGSGFFSLITQNVTQGTTYIIVVGTYCSFDVGTFTLQATSPIFNGGTSNWYLNPTGGTPLATGNVFNPVGVAGSGIPNTSIPGTYNFYVANANYPTCRTQTTFTIVPTQSVGGTVSSATVCSVSNSGVVTLTGNVGNIIRWEISTDNFATQRDEYNFTGNTLPYSNLTQTTQYRVVVQYQNLPPVISSIGVVTVGNISVAGSVTPDVALCSGANSGALLLSGHTGNILNWESSTDNFATKTTIANTSTVLTYTNLTQETKYRAVVQNGTCVASNSAPATLSIIPLTVGGSVSSSVTVCAVSNGGTLTLSGSVGSVLRWESSNDNFVTKSDIANTTFSQAYSNLTGTTQYRAVLQSQNCAIVNSSVAVITVDSASLGGTVNSSVSVCANANAGTLNLIGRRGSILRWELSTDNFVTNTAIANITTSQAFLNLTQSTRYRAVVKNGICPAVNANPALVTITPLPTMTAPTITQPTCFTSGTIVVNAANIVNGIPTQTFTGSNDATDATQTGRVYRNGIIAACGSVKPFDSFYDNSTRYYDSYTITNTTSSSQCINVSLTGTNTTNLYFTMYSGSFNPASISTNFIGDPGASNDPMLASQTIAAGATLTIVVHNVEIGLAAGAYTLTVGGAGATPAAVEYSINNGTTWQATNTFPGLIGGNYNLVSRTVGGGNCIVPYTSNPVTITIPANGTVGGVVVGSNSAVCTGTNTGTLTLTGHTGDVLRWESSTDNFATITTINNITTSNTFSNLSLTTKYRAVVQNGACAAANSLAASISVLSPSIPVITGGAVSNGNSIELGASGCTNGLLQWFKTTDNSPVTMPVTPTVNTQYYAKCQLTQGSTSCLSGNSNDAQLLVIPKDLIYVNASNTAAIQDGASWATAMSDLQNALSFSENNTSVWVQAGTYKPTTTTDRNLSFNVPSGVKLYGGFSGTETTLQQRGKTAETILSGDIGTEADESDNSYHVLTVLDATENPIIDRFSVQNGYASNQPLSFNSDASSKNETKNQAGLTTIYTERGGGIYIQNSSPMITNCKIQNNSAGSGGGIYAEVNSVPTIKFCIISGNNATLGGGIYNHNSNSLIDNSLITGNKGFGGAAVYNNRSNPVMNNLTISGNDCLVGNIFNTSGSNASNPVIKNSIIWNNTGTLDNLSAITYSIVEGGYTGTGNLNIDPQFVSAQAPSAAPTVAGNYRVVYGSPSVDVGDNGSISLTDLDLDGNLRRYDGATVDMGAYELIGNFDTANSGGWDVNSTWKCNCVPDGSLPVRIMGNHEVIIPNGMTGQAKGLKFVGDGKLLPMGTGSINIVR
jgi:Fungalysin metallopeptidase (M36)